MNIQDRTGAGAGIGRAIAELFAQAGAAVVVSDRAFETAETVSRSIGQAGGKAIAAACDVTKEEQLEALVRRTVRGLKAGGEMRS